MQHLYWNQDAFIRTGTPTSLTSKKVLEFATLCWGCSKVRDVPMVSHKQTITGNFKEKFPKNENNSNMDLEIL